MNRGDANLARMIHAGTMCSFTFVLALRGTSGKPFHPSFEMVTRRPADIIGLPDYGVEVGKSADCVVLDCLGRHAAVAELAPPICGFKRGRMTFKREPAQLLTPH